MSSISRQRRNSQRHESHFVKIRASWDPTLKNYFKQVISIYKNGRNFTNMSPADITGLEQFTSLDNEAGSAARHTLEFFTGKHYPVKPFVHIAGQQIYTANSTAGVNNPASKQLRFSIFPNPSASQFELQYSIVGSYNTAELKWYDELGRPVKSLILTGQEGSIAISNSELGKAGLYKCILFINGSPAGMPHVPAAQYILPAAAVALVSEELVEMVAVEDLVEMVAEYG